MMLHRKVSSLRAQLLVLVGIIVVPIAIICLMLAVTNYQTVISRITETRVGTSADFAFRTRLWLRGFLRTAETTLATVGSTIDGPLCADVGMRVLRTSTAFVYIDIGKPGSAPCAASVVEPGLTDQFAAAVAAHKALPAQTSWFQGLGNSFRYDIVRIDGKFYGIAGTRDSPDNSNSRHTSIVFKLEQLDSVFEIGEIGSGTKLGIVKKGATAVVARGTDEHDASWLPVAWPEGVIPRHWTARSQDGQVMVYSSHIVIEPDFYVLSRFSNNAETDARNQLIFLGGTPLLLLLLLVLSYWHFVDRLFVKSIEAVERAAISEAAGDTNARAPLIRGMPDEIQRVAEAFNRMADAASDREGYLRRLLNENRNLMRELHHRVKNSLQVIQSYLAITRRSQPDGSANVMREAESRVQVLAIAYRYALTEHGLRAVPVRQFVDELLSNVAEAFRRSNHKITSSIVTDAKLDVDRIIPLGLAITEIAFAGVRSEQCDTVHVSIQTTSSSDFRFTISMNGEAGSVSYPQRTLAGLRLQLGAISEEPQGDEQLRWTVGTN